MDRLNIFLWVISIRRHLFFSIVFSATLVAIVFVFILPKEYTAVGSILPSGSGFSTPAFLKNIFPSFGAATELESDIYPDVLGSRTLLEKVFSKEYSYKKHGKVVTNNLFKAFGWANIDEVLLHYPEKIKISTSLQTGLLKIAVTTHYPELSADIVNELIKQLDEFNQHTRKSKAKDNLEYIRARLNELKGELNAAEDSLTDFLLRHRDYESTASPEVKLDVERLQRQKQIKEQAFLLINQQYELAKLEVKKNTPIVSVLDWASPPIRKSGPKRTIIILVVFLISIIIATTVSFALTPQRDFPSDKSPLELFREDAKKFIRKLSKAQK